MKIWRYSTKDSIMFILSLLNIIVSITLALSWSNLSISAWSVNVTILSFMTTYNIIVISHFLLIPRGLYHQL
ncbi:hypothetical protein Xhom_03767 [Xenorhabdus hominickii]|uniref:Uncharacterized protein n=1 Tax=Xenorhabdus hominickii TaxID=351679 RepID=A0A2G0Q186_XENHO|nr:hypothetical protein Xhom_04661 [Xenorhabdus hominickii]PHM52972.1 hypothetical protein Xhom_03854 [Xenorhabdus hominickii]PHM53766.1 hypothetical protein Xhom_03767 [Xenorhabdus hominickii]